MPTKRRILPVLVSLGTTLGGCDKDSDGDAPKKDATPAKQEPKKEATPPKEDPEEEPKEDPKEEPEAKPITIIHENDEVPVRLGGAVAVPSPDMKIGKLGAEPAPSEGAATPAPAAPAAARAAAATPEPKAADEPLAVAVVHNHPPGEECTPLSEAEVKKALADLRAKP